MKDKIKQYLRSSRGVKHYIEIWRHIFSPVQQFTIWHDYFETKKVTKFIREHSYVNEKKTALIVASDNIYQVKIEALLATGLRLSDGWRIIVLTSKLSPWVERYFKLFGISEYVYCEDYFSRDQGADRQRKQIILDEYFKGKLGFQVIKNWSYKGASIGPQILSTVSRLMQDGLTDFNSPFLVSTFKKVTEKSINAVNVAEKILSKIMPELIYLNEANYAINGALVDVAIGCNIDVIQVVQPARDDALIFKRLNKKTRGLHPASLSEESMCALSAKPWIPAYDDFIKKEFERRYNGHWFLQARNQPCVREMSKDEVLASLQLDPSKKIAVIFSHILWDANLFYGEDLFDDYTDWYLQTIKAACENDKVNWVIKLHPANLWKRAREKIEGDFSEVKLIDQCLGALPKHIRLLYPDSPISTLSLYKVIDYCITVRGTAGLEAPCFGVLSFTAGTGRYSNLGFTVDSSTKEEYLRKLLSINEYPVMTNASVFRARLHAHALFKFRPWEFRSFTAIFNYKKFGSHPLDHNVKINADSVDKLLSFGDLMEWAHWVESSSNVDYLSPALALK